MTVPCPGDTIAHLLGMRWTGPVITAIVSSRSKYQLHCSRLVVTVVVTAPVLDLSRDRDGENRTSGAKIW